MVGRNIKVRKNYPLTLIASNNALFTSNFYRLKIIPAGPASRTIAVSRAADPTSCFRAYPFRWAPNEKALKY